LLSRREPWRNGGSKVESGPLTFQVCKKKVKPTTALKGVFSTADRESWFAVIWGLLFSQHEKRKGEIERGR